MMVYRWVQLQGDGKTEAQHPTTSSDPQMAPRHLAWLFLRYPEHLEKQEQQTLSRIRQEKNVEIVYGLSQQFVTMVKERHAQLVDTWLRDCRMSGITDLVTFAASDWKRKPLLFRRP